MGGCYDRRRPAPFAECLPLARPDLVKRRFDTVGVFAPGGATMPLPTRAGPADVVVCNEGMLADAARDCVLEGAIWLRPRSDRTLYARVDDRFGLLCALAVATGLALAPQSRPGAP